MQGTGIANRFLGLEEEFSSEEKAKIVILPVPFDKTTTYKKGSEKGPEALIEASRNLELYDVETQGEVFKKGIHTANPICSEMSEEMLEKLQSQTRSYIKKGKFVVTLGGEHSISFAPIAAHAENKRPFSVLQFDAHTDLVQAYENNPLSHASVMARVKSLEEVDQIVAVGIRSIASEELSEIDSTTTFCAHTLFDNDDWMDRVVDLLSGDVYITFDLDVFDSSIMPSTGTPEPGGMDWRMVTKLLKKVAEAKNIIGFDVVELCPIPSFWAPDFLAAKLTYKILSYIFSKQGR